MTLQLRLSPGTLLTAQQPSPLAGYPPHPHRGYPRYRTAPACPSPASRSAAARPCCCCSHRPRPPPPGREWQRWSPDAAVPQRHQSTWRRLRGRQPPSPRGTKRPLPAAASGAALAPAHPRSVAPGWGGVWRARRRRGGSGPEGAPWGRGRPEVSARAARSGRCPEAAPLGLGPARASHLLNGFRLQAGAALILPFSLSRGTSPNRVLPSEDGSCQGGLWGRGEAGNPRCPLVEGRVHHRDQSQSHWHGRTRNEDVHVGGRKENQLSKWPASPHGAGSRPLWWGTECCSRTVEFSSRPPAEWARPGKTPKCCCLHEDREVLSRWHYHLPPRNQDTVFQQAIRKHGPESKQLESVRGCMWVGEKQPAV